MKPLGQLIDSCTMVVPPYAGGVGVQSRSHGHEPFAIVALEVRRLLASALIEESGVESVQRILRVPVHFAYPYGKIAVVAKHLRHLITIMLCYFSIPQKTVMPW